MVKNNFIKNRSLNGFTIVELTIVIVIIGILAAIVVVSYNGLAQRARETTLKSDLTQNSSHIANERSKTGRYPATQALAGLDSSDGATLTYYVSLDRKSYCLQAVGWEISYIITHDNTDPRRGYCNGATGVEGTELGPGIPEATTLAGNDSNSYGEGTGAAASFGSPAGMDVDSSGNVFVADSYNHRIRMVTSAGVVSTVAGNGAYGSGSGSTNGTGTGARFSSPRDVAIDKTGTYLYVADSGNNMIRRINSAGVVTTYAGATSSGNTNSSTPTTARFSTPSGLAIDSNNNIYVADTGNNRIRKITPAGVVTTFAGSSSGFVNATGTSARFKQPMDVAVDGLDNIYVADTGNSAIRKITPAGVVITIAGNGTAGWNNAVGTSAQFNLPKGVVVDAAGNIYVADTDGDEIRKITPDTTVTTYTGSWGNNIDGPIPDAQVRRPWGITIGPDGAMYVTTEHRVRKIE